MFITGDEVKKAVYHLKSFARLVKW